MQVDFYHLTRLPLERALPQIAEKVLGSGARLLIVAEDAGRRREIDQLLWSYAPDAFLPHAPAGGDHDSEQPILIADTTAAPNGARHIALADGVWRDAALAFERVFHFFDETGIEAARAAWRGLATRDDIARNYWRQDDRGRWERVA